MKFKNVHDVGKWRLCAGCGACAYICPQHEVQLVDIINDGIRPVVKNDSGCPSCLECLSVCPGISIFHNADGHEQKFLPEFHKHWGPVLEVWEGHAVDPEIRLKGSSGGLATALSIFCIEKKKSFGVLHIGATAGIPWKNSTYLSRNRHELISRSGSRYSPASPCDGLEMIESSLKPCAFVGKPCDIVGLRKAQALRPGLDNNIELAIGFFCAGTPSTLASLDFFDSLKIARKVIHNFRYRGKGWPGMATIKLKEPSTESIKVSYHESWGFLQKYRPFRCYLCPDLTAEFSDISVGDPWYREISEDEPGQSLILIRTERGRQIFHEAVADGLIAAWPSDSSKLLASQKRLLTKRQSLWGRLLALKILRIPTPQFKGFQLSINWLGLLPTIEKFKSISGTVKRAIQRNYFRPKEY